MLLWRFFCGCLGFLLFSHSSFPTYAVGLLFWIIFDINRVANGEYFDMCGYFGSGPNWLQARLPVWPNRSSQAPAKQEQWRIMISIL